MDWSFPAGQCRREGFPAAGYKDLVEWPDAAIMTESMRNQRLSMGGMLQLVLPIGNPWRNLTVTMGGITLMRGEDHGADGRSIGGALGPIAGPIASVMIQLSGSMVLWPSQASWPSSQSIANPCTDVQRSSATVSA